MSRDDRAELRSDCRDLIAALRPAALAFGRAQRLGYLTLDDEAGWVESLDVIPSDPTNPDQLPLV